MFGSILAKIGTMLATVLIDKIVNGIREWWNKRQLAYYQAQAKHYRRMKESLEAGVAVESEIQKAAEAEIKASAKAVDAAAKIHMLRRRAIERKNNA